ncbi:MULTISPECIES: PaaI family thioesterase [Pseudomonas aeruginosa group]|uniref:PaaI family thioesterase n=1 Tax=Pseudomonas nitroreducens TaxID=46680 RepID=A0A6G6ISP0_PSENT|nr:MULTISPECIES: PaaI family thioesterase [Pseudomonas aeruginosa group]QIE86014.1 PaaI family thioesterase [Pseudomonas nitroreducens]HCE6396335.1 PaaI family thioesterase [Pseudomonas aeruginosa]
MSKTQDNPDRLFIQEFITNQWTDRPVTGSPLAVLLGMKLLSASRGEIRASFDVGSNFTQGGGAVQGGIVTSLLDFGMAFAGLSVLDTGKTATTIALSVNFLRPAYSGIHEVHAQLDKVGRNLLYASAKLYCQNGSLIATANSPLAIISIPS